jgi:hypothetical protein
VPCPRDPELEAVAWPAIETITACRERPTGSGQADVVIDFATGVPTEVRSRDTFADDVVRLDAARVVDCVAPALATVQQHLGSARLVVSFRFSLRERR